MIQWSLHSSPFNGDVSVIHRTIALGLLRLDVMQPLMHTRGMRVYNYRQGLLVGRAVPA